MSARPRSTSSRKWEIPPRFRFSPTARSDLATTHSSGSPSGPRPTGSILNSRLPVPDARVLNEEDFRRLCEFLYRRTGMVFGEAKRYYVERRVLERMSATGSGSFASYFARLRTDA